MDANERAKKHKKERFVAWVITMIILAVVAAGIFFVVNRYGSTIARTVKDAVKRPEPVAEETTEEEQTPEETEPSPEDKAMDEDSLNAIFDKEEDTVSEDTVSQPDAARSEDDELTLKAKELVEAMTTEQKVAQIFFVEPESLTDVDVATAAGEKTRVALTERPVGGIIFFAKNIESPDQIKQMNANLQRYSNEIVKVPMFTGIDEEGGSVVRIEGNESFEGEDSPVKKVDTMEKLGSGGDEKAAYEAALTIGTYLREYGFNLDLAPVADVSVEGRKNALGDRIFSSDPKVVAGMVSSYLAGLHDAQVLGAVKHFPGIGGIEKDLHNSAGTIEDDWDALLERELVPFSRAIDEDVKFIMVSHASLPGLTGDEIPASLSGIILTQKLRMEMGYKGVIITDAMNMKAITESHDSAEAAVTSIKAGADMILMPEDFEKAYEGVLEAVSSGELSEERIAESAERIVRAKLILVND